MRSRVWSRQTFDYKIEKHIRLELVTGEEDVCMRNRENLNLI